MMQYDEQDIWRYLTDAMDSDERAAFDNALKADLQLQKAVEEESELIRFVKQKNAKEKALSNLHEVHMKMTHEALTPIPMKHLNKSRVKKTTIPILKWLIPLAVAASMLLGYLYVSPSLQTQQTAPEIYATHFTPREMSANTRGGIPSDDISEIFRLFNAKKYPETLSFLESITPPEQLADRLDYMRAICLISTDKTEEARSVLTALATRNPIYSDDVMWYTGLSFLKDNNKEAATEVLSKIPENYTRYNEVERILDRIK